MRIAGVGYALPQRKLTNAQVVELFSRASRRNFSPPQLEEFERRIGLFLEMSGIACRHVAGEGDAPFDLAASATRNALAAAGRDAAEIDLLIYASVARGWLEPCTAVAVQHAVGAVNATGFDVLDACAGWLRAMHLAHTLINAGVYRNALIVNLEAGMLDFIRFDLGAMRDIALYGAAATLGNAAAATFVEASDDDDFHFNVRTFPERPDLCMMPLANAAGFDAAAAAALGGTHFVADSTALIGATMRRLIEVYLGDPHLRRQRYDIVFPHAVSARVNRQIAEATQVPVAVLYSSLRNHGNTASASVPLAIGLALEEGRLRRGEWVGIAIGGAGITIGLATFTF